MIQKSARAGVEGPDRPRGGGHAFLGWGRRSGPGSLLCQAQS